MTADFFELMHRPWFSNQLHKLFKSAANILFASMYVEGVNERYISFLAVLFCICLVMSVLIKPKQLSRFLKLGSKRREAFYDAGRKMVYYDTITPYTSC
ncbi:unnamed protein product [Acanthoscelides obtectus]|uniref:Uncharacterized protein n=1 Tax=Acanthoscelides obtectus TaxID=200917 RepID=A0A9P0JJY4_ACAOB|nr:unnamed protein product [Acanthoscelides obtectus]CAK1661583.1 hypothetical protein AOBTE_LOCUS22697 [Acanthoscelides obtectus]